MHGLRVLDLSRGIAGEFCARLLCGYGAEVIKIEHPQHPSATRGIPPFLRDEPGLDRSALFWHLNGGKQGITLDLSSAAGRHAAMGLAAIADVVIEDLTPGALDDMGLGYASLRRARPDVILTSVTPFGQSGPMRGHKATELGLLAAGGELYITGTPDREPIKPGAHLASHAGGLQAVVATSAALCLRQATGMGRHIDVSVQEAVGMFLSGGACLGPSLRPDPDSRRSPCGPGDGAPCLLRQHSAVQRRLPLVRHGAQPGHDWTTCR